MFNFCISKYNDLLQHEPLVCLCSPWRLAPPRGRGTSSSSMMKEKHLKNEEATLSHHHNFEYVQIQIPGHNPQ